MRVWFQLRRETKINFDRTKTTEFTINLCGRNFELLYTRPWELEREFYFDTEKGYLNAHQ